MDQEHTFDNIGALAQKLGIRITYLSGEKASAVMPVEGNTQPLGLLNGGASAALAETLASRAANTYAKQLGKVAVGVELSISHHRSTRDGQVEAVASALHLGKTLATYQVQVFTELNHRLLATARLTCALIEPRS